MDNWFSNLQAQLSATSAPAGDEETVPEHTKLKHWATTLAKAALQEVKDDMSIHGHMIADTAVKVSHTPQMSSPWNSLLNNAPIPNTQVQRALLVCLITGSFIPPLRLDLIRNLDTQEFNQRNGCSDGDCLKKLHSHCKGNRLELIKR